MESADLATFTEKILNRKLYFLCRGTTSDNELYNKWQRVAANDSGWSFQLISLFLIREKPTTKDNSLNLEEDLDKGLLN